MMRENLFDTSVNNIVKYGHKVWDLLGLFTIGVVFATALAIVMIALMLWEEAGNVWHK